MKETEKTMSRRRKQEELGKMKKVVILVVPAGNHI
jgi:hypothetical protein